MDGQGRTTGFGTWTQVEIGSKGAGNMCKDDKTGFHFSTRTTPGLLLLFIIIVLAGCADNRVRIKPTVQTIDNPALRLEMMRRIYNGLALQKAEEEYEL